MAIHFLKFNLENRKRNGGSQKTIYYSIPLNLINLISKHIHKYITKQHLYIPAQIFHTTVPNEKSAFAHRHFYDPSSYLQFKTPKRYVYVYHIRARHSYMHTAETLGIFFPCRTSARADAHNCLLSPVAVPAEQSPIERIAPDAIAHAYSRAS